MLRDEPDLWWIVHLWRSPISRELTFEILSQLTRFELEAWEVLSSTSYRAEMRKAEKK